MRNNCSKLYFDDKIEVDNTKQLDIAKKKKPKNSNK